MSTRRILHWPLLTALLLILAVPALAQEPDTHLDEIMEELTAALELSDEQVPEVEKHLTSYLVNLNESQAKYEDVEEPDPQEMISDLKQVRESYYKSMQKTLSKEQWQQYEALRESILLEIFSEIAALRIIDLKEPLTLTDEQMAAMKPVMGKSLRGVIGTLFEYGDKRLGVRTKLKIANALKSIKAEQDTEMKTILSEEQLEQVEHRLKRRQRHRQERDEGHDRPRRGRRP